MPVTINGSTGIAGVDGSAGTPSVQGTDSNTGIFFPAADTVAIATGGTEAMRVDSSQNVGIGVTPSAWGSGQKALQIGVGTGQDAMFWLGGNDTEVLTNAYNNGGWKYQTTGGSATRYAQSGGVHYWFNAPGGTAGNAITWTQAMTLDSSGNLLVGQTSASNTEAGTRLEPAGRWVVVRGTGTGSQTIAAFYRADGGGSAIGTITTTNTATSYVTSSDYRLKHDIAPMTGALAKVAALKPVTYKWNADDSDGQGFIAHELQEVVPDAVVGEKDAVDAEGNPIYQGIDTSFLVATLTAAIQELTAKLDAAEARIAALEAK